MFWKIMSYWLTASSGAALGFILASILRVGADSDRRK